MKEIIQFEKNQDDIDIIKYLLVLFKNLKKIVFFSLISLVITYLHINSTKSLHQASINIGEKKRLSFMLSEAANESINKTNYSSRIFFEMFSESFLNFDNLSYVYESLDDDIKLKISNEELFKSIKISDLDTEKRKIYSIESNVTPTLNKLILKKLVLNSQSSVFDKLIGDLNLSKIQIESSIDLIRLKHRNDLDAQKKRLIYESNKIKDLTKSLAHNQIKELENNILIAKKMGYIEPLFITSETELVLLEDDYSYNYFYGTKILSLKLDILKKEIERDISSINPILANDIKFIDEQNNDVFIKDIENLKYELDLYLLAINNLNEVYSKQNNNSFITDFDLDRIDVEKLGRSSLLTYLIALVCGITFGCVYAILQYIISFRLSNENEVELIDILKSDKFK